MRAWRWGNRPIVDVKPACAVFCDLWGWEHDGGGGDAGRTAGFEVDVEGRRGEVVGVDGLSGEVIVLCVFEGEAFGWGVGERFGGGGHGAYEGHGLRGSAGVAVCWGLVGARVVAPTSACGLCLVQELGCFAAVGCAGGVVGPWGWVVLVEVADFEDVAQEGPGEGEVGDKDGGRGLAHVPVDPGPLVRVFEGVVAVHDAGCYDEDAEGEDAA